MGVAPCLWPISPSCLRLSGPALLMPLSLVPVLKHPPAGVKWQSCTATMETGLIAPACYERPSNGAHPLRCTSLELAPNGMPWRRMPLIEQERPSNMAVVLQSGCRACRLPFCSMHDEEQVTRITVAP